MQIHLTRYSECANAIYTEYKDSKEKYGRLAESWRSFVIKKRPEFAEKIAGENPNNPTNSITLMTLIR